MSWMGSIHKEDCFSSRIAKFSCWQKLHFRRNQKIVGCEFCHRATATKIITDSFNLLHSTVNESMDEPKMIGLLERILFEKPFATIGVKNIQEKVPLKRLLRKTFWSF